MGGMRKGKEMVGPRAEGRGGRHRAMLLSLGAARRCFLTCHAAFLGILSPQQPAKGISHKVKERLDGKMEPEMHLMAAWL